mgnify:CR=1 FL=1
MLSATIGRSMASSCIRKPRPRPGNGVTYRELAAYLGLPTSTFKRLAALAGITTRPVITWRKGTLDTRPRPTTMRHHVPFTSAQALAIITAARLLGPKGLRQL